MKENEIKSLLLFLLFALIMFLIACSDDTNHLIIHVDGPYVTTVEKVNGKYVPVTKRADDGR